LGKAQRQSQRHHGEGNQRPSKDFAQRAVGAGCPKPQRKPPGKRCDRQQPKGSEAWDFAHNNFSEDKMVESYLEFYETILAERKGTSTSLL
jgi:hypothetical protein